jgi:hypothetical protein
MPPVDLVPVRDAAPAAVDDAAPRVVVDARPPSRVLRGATVGLLAGALVWVTMARLTGAVSLFLSPDGGHYLTDADALLGDGVRALAHPPAFPLLVALSKGLVGPVGQVQVALGVSLWLLVVALYLLCRQYAGFTASVVGAGVGATFPAIAELLAWNGGATLLATAFLVFALAALEWWLRTGTPWAALVVGVALAAALLAHPFVAAVAVVCVGVRWIVELVARGGVRRLAWRRTPFSLAQVTAVALPVLLALPVALPYYTAVEADAGVQFGVPRLGPTWDTLTWGLREQGSLLLLFLVLAVAAFVGGRGPATLTGTLAAVYLLIASATRADPSYRTRVAYLLPIVGAVGAALLWQRLAPTVAARVAAWSGRRPDAIVLVAGVVVVIVFASLGYLPRIPRAAAFYQRLDPVDVTALQTLGRSHAGLVATSWNQNAYGNGISNSWYIEGLAQRRAAGPTDPALSTIAREVRDGAAMQQFFAGEAGVENGALQLATGPQSGFDTPGLQAEIGGMYRPVLYVNDAVNAYPTPLGRLAKEFGDLADGAHVTHGVDGSAITGRYVAAGSNDATVTMRASVHARRATFTYHAPRASRSRLAIRLYPGYGVLWRDVRDDDGVLKFTTDPYTLTGVTTSGPHGLPVEIRPVQGTHLRFVERDPQFGLQSTELSAARDGSVHFTVTVGGDATVHPTRRFDQRSLLRRYDIRDVVVWKDTGWAARFQNTACYAQLQETRRLLIFQVRPQCRPADRISSTARG